MRALLPALLLVPLLLAGCAEPGDDLADDASPPGGTPPTAAPGDTPVPGAGTPPPQPGNGNSADPGGPPPTPLPPNETALTFREMANGSMSEIPYPVRLVFTDAQEWETFWRDHHKKSFGEAGETPPPPAPQADFTRERVVAVTLGDRSDACWAVRVTNASMSDDATVLTVTTYRAGPDMACGSVITQPYVMVAIPADGGEVVYRDEEVRGPVPGTA